MGHRKHQGKLAAIKLFHALFVVNWKHGHRIGRKKIINVLPCVARDDACGALEPDFWLSRKRRDG